MKNRELIERFADNKVTANAVIDMLERLVELEEVSFRDEEPFWISTGDDLTAIPEGV